MSYSLATSSDSRHGKTTSSKCPGSFLWYRLVERTMPASDTVAPSDLVFTASESRRATSVSGNAFRISSSNAWMPIQEPFKWTHQHFGQFEGTFSPWPQWWQRRRFSGDTWSARARSQRGQPNAYEQSWQTNARYAHRRLKYTRTRPFFSSVAAARSKNSRLTYAESLGERERSTRVIMGFENAWSDSDGCGRSDFRTLGDRPHPSES